MAKQKKVPPRQTPSRDEHYMGLIFWMAAKSKDPSSQCGAVIVSGDNDPLGWGYNGPPKKIKDKNINWDRPDKYPFIKHAEENAIRNAIRSGSMQLLENSVMYVSGKPCKDCMLSIVDWGIPKVIYFPYKNKDPKSMLADPNTYSLTDEIAAEGSVVLQKFKGDLNWMQDEIKRLKKIGIFS